MIVESNIGTGRGTRVGELATERFPGGVLIDLPYQQMTEKVEATKRALDEGVPAIFEASFWEDLCLTFLPFTGGLGTPRADHPLLNLNTSRTAFRGMITFMRCVVWRRSQRFSFVSLS